MSDSAPASAAHAPAANAPQELDRRTLIVAGVVMLGAIMSILDTTVVNVAIDRLALDFHSSLTTIQWVVTGYTLSLAAVIPLSGWASDRFGTKRLYLSSLVLFTLGSVLSGLSWSAESLIGFRVLQGLGGGMIMPAVMTIVTQKAGPQRMGRVMGILGVPMLIAPIIGPILGGWLVDDVSWRWIFFINLPIGIVAFISGLLVLEPDRSVPSHKLDWIGMLQLSPGLALLIYGLAESSPYGFSDARAWAPLVVGALLIVAFFVHSWRTTTPLIDIKTFTRTQAGASAIVFALFSIAFFGAFLLVPLYYQSVRNASALDAGLLLVPQGVGAMITMPIAGKLTDRYGPWRWPAAGIPLLVIGLIPFAFVTAHTSYVLLCGFNFVLGLGMGMSMMPTMTAAMQAVPSAAIPRVSTAMNIIRQAGASIGTAVMTVLLSTAIKDRLSFLPAVHHGGNGFASLQHVSPAQHATVAGPLASAFAHTFVWALVMLGVAFVPALWMAVRERRSQAGAQAASDNQAGARAPVGPDAAARVEAQVPADASVAVE